ncbi:MAG: amidohydrolase [bacterium]|nr:amidohydrolase [bacterium]
MNQPIALFSLVAYLGIAFAGVASAGKNLGEAARRDYDESLGALFEYFHRNPELSFREVETAARLAEELRKAGAEVTTGVGGTGVVGMIRNGGGATVLVRADMDGLPIREQSGLAYASTRSQTGPDGSEIPVMHACGHDVHMTSLVGTAKRLIANRDHWSGTVMLVGQPAEERIGGAKAMLADGLYERFGVPDHALGLHIIASGPTGRISISDGSTAASADSIDLVVHGVVSHGAAPQNGKDAVYVAAQIVVALQSLVSRELNPLEAGVITVGSIHGGRKHNVLADEVKLEITVRADTEAVRQTLLSGIRRIARGVALTHGVAESALPTVEVVESTPPNENDPATVAIVKRAIARELGEDAFFQLKRDSMGAEDFAYFVETEDDVPGAYFAVGGTPQAVLDAAAEGGPPAPFHHSPFFKIEPLESVVTSVRAMSAAVMELLPTK